ncbi:hypothetical protein DOE78_00270 [Bacillus sp. Y1]|nr:hypothetical protein DOE78_00270 [Bacillus sp. Y1]
MLDSWGISGTGETPQEQSDEEAHRPPPGKQAPGVEISLFSTNPNKKVTKGNEKHRSILNGVSHS